MPSFFPDFNDTGAGSVRLSDVIKLSVLLTWLDGKWYKLASSVDARMIAEWRRNDGRRRSADR